MLVRWLWYFQGLLEIPGLWDFPMKEQEGEGIIHRATDSVTSPAVVYDHPTGTTNPGNKPLLVSALSSLALPRLRSCFSFLFTPPSLKCMMCHESLISLLLRIKHPLNWNMMLFLLRSEARGSFAWESRRKKKKKIKKKRKRKNPSFFALTELHADVKTGEQFSHLLCCVFQIDKFVFVACWCQFMLRSQVLALYRSFLRTTKGMEKPMAVETRQWIRDEFERNRTTKDEVLFPVLVCLCLFAWDSLSLPNPCHSNTLKCCYHKERPRWSSCNPASSSVATKTFKCKIYRWKMIMKSL